MSNFGDTTQLNDNIISSRRRSSIKGKLPGNIPVINWNHFVLVILRSDCHEHVIRSDRPNRSNGT